MSDVVSNDEDIERTNLELKLADLPVNLIADKKATWAGFDKPIRLLT
jgi:hypothetical protein